MKERPILFSAPMVRAILAGQKTQTRRAFSPYTEKLMCAAASIGEVSWFMDNGGLEENDLAYVQQFCPYGQPGDRLWVRESWADLTQTHGQRWERLNCETGLYERGINPFAWYRADGDQPDVGDGATHYAPWRPSIHMPRWASRILLEVVAIRVERLQDISDADCIAEGAPGGHGAIPGYTYNATPQEHYRHIWTSINGPASWDSNPWVWVVEFKRVESPSNGD